MQVNNLFGSPIWHYNITSIDNNALKNYIIDWKNHGESRFISNVNGWQSNDIPLDSQVFQKFFYNAQSILNSSFDELGGRTNEYKVVMDNCWANINTKGSFNWGHTHDGFLSLVYYVQADEDTGNIQFLHPSPLYQKNWDSSCFNNSSTSTNSEWVFEPKTSRCLVFPSWLEHRVDVNNTEKIRISISLNSRLEKI